MSERDDKDHNESPQNEQTLIRGQDQTSSEANDDATILRPKDKQAQVQERNDDETVLRSKDPVAQEPNDDETVLRQKDTASTAANDNETRLRGAVPEPNDAATILRGGKDAADEMGAADETVVRSDESKARASDPRPEPVQDGGDATILRAPSEASGDSSDSATILRSPSRREAGEAETVMRESDDGDATILRVGGEDDDDDDRTVLNDNYDDDATVIGPGGDGEDTTYIASVGKQIRPKGNSEAGRLLKNRFVLEEKIGSGGMGDVYKALDLRQQEAQERDPYIAIKLLNENFARHKDAFLSLQRETSRTRGIPHPHIMAVYDFDREGDTVFMSMELLDGKPLDDFLKEHPEGVSEEDAWNIIDGISQGLMRAHNAGIVHSDFKPGNIFYTKDKMAKVFDFGIARAVSNPNDLESDGEKTVFDAGSLGALTPTYASYEMLKGLEPSKSDDVYAVALVAYELFMGKHPYDRVPADKAFERGLKPAPVPFIKRRHWRALKKALELKGEDRTQTMDEFYEGMFSEDPPYFRYAAIGTVLLGSIGFGAYQATNVVERPAELVELESVMEASERTIRASLENANESLWKSDVWHDQLEEALVQWKGAEYTILENEQWVEDWQLTEDLRIEEYTNDILTAYLERINLLRTEAFGYDQGKHDLYGVEQAIAKLEEADGYMARIKKSYYMANPGEVTKEDGQLQVRLQLRTERLAEIEEQEARDLAAAEAEAKRIEEDRLRREFEQNRLAAYNKDLDEVREILKCKGNISAADLEEFGRRLSSMRSGWIEAYEHHYPTLVKYTAQCIQQRIGFVEPKRAREVQAVVASYFPGERQISGIVIEDHDPCDDRKLVGRGNRSGRWCTDPLSEGGEGPELVVVPALTVNSHKFAVSRTEIKVADYNFYCQQTGCAQIQSSSISLPVTNISIGQAEEYVGWLSAQSGEKYRLPTVDEWSYVAEAKNPIVDENINCTVDSRGVRLGETLLNAVSGRSNDWGLYNYVGNAREWAVAEDGTFRALGGAHTDPRNECTLQKSVAHQGDADPVTGFRVIREIEEKDRNSSTPDLAASN